MLTVEFTVCGVPCIGLPSSVTCVSAGTGPFEIHLWTDDGRLLVAPHLIVHLIEAHGYQPPPELVAAAGAEAGEWHRVVRGALAEAVAQLAEDHPDQRRWVLEGLRERLPATVWYAAGPEPDVVDGHLRLALTPGHTGAALPAPAAGAAPPAPAVAWPWLGVERLLIDRPELAGVVLRAGMEVRLSRADLDL